MIKLISQIDRPYSVLNFSTYVGRPRFLSAIFTDPDRA